MSADISGIGGRITVLTLVATRGKISVEVLLGDGAARGQAADRARREPLNRVLRPKRNANEAREVLYPRL